MRPGDVFVGNDAYAGGGTHLPDIVLAEPIFVDGRIVAWTVNLAHHADFADRGHAHIYQEGLRIPPIRLYRAGELQKDVLDLILLNCQVPRERLSDLRAQMAANRLGVQRFQALCAKYGTDDRARRRRGAAGLRRAQDARRHRRDPGRHLSLRRRVRQSRDRRRAADLASTITVAGDEMRLHFDSPPQVARRHQHDLHGAARDRLLRGQVGGRSDHPAERRPRAAADRHRAGRHDPQLRASGRRERPRADLPARRRPDPRRARAGGAGARHRPAPTASCRVATFIGEHADGRHDLGLSRDHGRRLRRARRPRTASTACMST